jgi:hypothetical protein
MTIVARIDGLIANLQGLRQAVEAERGAGFEAVLNAALDEADAVVGALPSATAMQRSNLSAPLEADPQNLMSLQKALRGTYTVSPSEDGRFEVRYPTGGVAGVYDTEALATRMSKVLAAGKASMIASANRMIVRDPSEDAALRSIGFTEAQIDSAYQRQIDNRDDARLRLQGMLHAEVAAGQIVNAGISVSDYYRLVLPKTED